MKPAIKLADLGYGTYYKVPDDHVGCAPRPSDDHLLADNWQADPMNPNVCWRIKKQAEIDIETDAEEVNLSFDGAMETIAKAFHNINNRVRVLEGKNEWTFKQTIKALRQL